MITRSLASRYVMIGCSLSGLMLCSIRPSLAADAGTAAPAAQPDDSILQEVVVTANKRAENMQDVASAVSVESGAQLMDRGLKNLADYAGDIPGLNIVGNGSPGQTSVEIRGISSNTRTSAVGTYLDDTPIGSSGGWALGSSTLLDMLPYDLERIEVLRGPQGTLYGEGAMGGLIKYVLKTPSTSDFDAEVGGSLSTIDGAANAGYSLRARVNTPIIPDVLGISLSAFGEQTPGYIDNTFTGQTNTNLDRQYGGRLAALWRPASNLSVKFTALAQIIEADDSAFRQFTSTTPAPNAGNSLLVTPQNPLPDMTENVPFPASYEQHLYYTAATVDWNLAPFDFVSATSWSKQTSLLWGDTTPLYGGLLPFIGGSGAGITNSIDNFGLNKFTQEFRLVSPKGNALEWMAGVFATRERSFHFFYAQAFTPQYQPEPGIGFPPGLFDAAYPESFDEYATFGNLTWNITDAFSLTGGARYAYNRQRIVFDILPAPFWPPPLPQFTPIETHQGVPTWMGSAQYRFSGNVMGYARVATGYRTGGPNSPLPNVPLTYKSDTLINYELGLKSTFLENRALVDVAVYRINWKDIQLTALSTPGDYNYETNGGRALSQGVELQTQYSPMRGLTLRLNGNYTDAHLTSVIPASSFLLTGYQLARVPKGSVSASADYDFALTSGWRAQVGGAYRYVGPQFAGIVESASSVSTPTYQAAGYSVFDLNGGIRRDHLNIRLTVRNLANNRALLAGGQLRTDGVTGVNDVLATFLQPRTLELGVDYAF
jgi:iron complex outermembrane recepter protein